MFGKFVRFCIRLLNNMLYDHAYAGSIQPKVNGWCVFKGRISLGTNNHFNGAKLYGQDGISIGDNFHSAEGLTILTQNYNWKREELPLDEAVVCRPVIIGGKSLTKVDFVVCVSILNFKISGEELVKDYFTLKKNEKFC